jgi:hypothetical protein
MCAWLCLGNLASHVGGLALGRVGREHAVGHLRVALLGHVLRAVDGLPLARKVLERQRAAARRALEARLRFCFVSRAPTSRCWALPLCHTLDPSLTCSIGLHRTRQCEKKSFPRATATCVRPGPFALCKSRRPPRNGAHATQRRGQGRKRKKKKKRAACSAKSRARRAGRTESSDARHDSKDSY